MTPKRPVLIWHGGKWRLAPWIIQHLPPHRVYVEPFGGAASVLLRKPRAYAEIYNDLDDDVVGLFRVLRDPPRAKLLIEALRLTPFSRREFAAAYDPSADPVERARRLVIRSFMGFGGRGHNAAVRTTVFRANSNRRGARPAHEWGNYPAALAAIIGRMSGVTVENRPALVVMRKHDGPQTLHYVDPPYLPELRSKSRRSGEKCHDYAHEMSEADHVALLGGLRSLAGMVVLSGYPSPLYDAALSDWTRVETAALADGAKKRTEVLWINPLAAKRLPPPSAPTLFYGEAA